MEFVSVVVLAFAAVLLLAGLFTAYFGTGKSRTVGIIMLVAGLAVGIVWAVLCSCSGIEVFEKVPLKDTVLRALANLAGVLIGALVAVAIFLVGVMKS